VVGKPKNPDLPLMNGVECALIDYGGIQFIDCNRIQPLREEFTRFPWSACHGCIKTSKSYVLKVLCNTLEICSVNRLNSF